MTTPIKFPPALPCTVADISATIVVDVRGYPHFDLPQNSLRIFEKIIEPDFQFGCHNFIAQHPFLPFISYDIITNRWDKKNKCKTEKRRTVAYSSHSDAAIFQIYSSILCWYYEEKIDSLIGKSVIAYRSLGETNIEFAHKAFSHIKSRGHCIVHALDLKDFFGSLDHKILKNRWAELIGEERLPPDHYAVFKALSKYSCVSRDDLFKILNYGKRKQGKIFPQICTVEDFRSKIRPHINFVINKTNKGIVQGSPLSACASNIYMMNFDRSISELCIRLDAYYRRYSDDLLIVCNPENEILIMDKLKALIAEHSLLLHDSKCVRTEIIPGKRLNCPIQYLGFTYDGEKILLRSSSLARYWRKMKLGVSKRKFCVSQKKKAGIIEPLYKGALLMKYTHFGKRENFPSYVSRAFEIIQEPGIKRQIRRHVVKLNRLILRKY